VLIQLPTGDWLDPAEVIAVDVIAAETDDDDDGLCQPRVLLRSGGEILGYIGEESSVADLRDEIARAVNLSLPDGPGGGR
jgi:hypothetical protein